MARLLYDNLDQIIKPYNRDDDEPVWGLDRNRYRVLAVVQQPQPDHDPATESVTPTEAIAWDSPAPDCDGTLTRGWRIDPIEPPPPPKPEADWAGFAGWLFQFPPMADGMERARASRDPQGEPCTTALPSALDEARLRSNYPTFGFVWSAFLAASGLSRDAIAEISGKAQACHLPEPFIQALGGASA